jgi:hypothetical protein
MCKLSPSQLLIGLSAAAVAVCLAVPALGQPGPQPYNAPERTVQVYPQPETWFPLGPDRHYREPWRLPAPPGLDWRHPGSREFGIPRAYYMPQWEPDRINLSRRYDLYGSRTPRLGDFYGLWRY